MAKTYTRTELEAEGFDFSNTRIGGRSIVMRMPARLSCAPFRR
jgi:hypothetical protein